MVVVGRPTLARNGFRLPYFQDQTVRRAPRLTHLVLFAVCFISLHTACFVVLSRRFEFATYPFLLALPTLTVAACLWRIRAEPKHARAAWILLCLGIFLWTCGMYLSAWEDMIQHLPASVAWCSDFCFFLFGAPLLLASSTPPVERRLPFFIWIDGFQVALTGYLTYIAIFSVTPFETGKVDPIPLSVLILTYNIENVILVLAATVRLFAQPRGPERAFFKILCAFMWIYAITAGIYNNWSAVSAATDNHPVFDAIIDLPFVLLIVAALTPPRNRSAATEAAPATERRQLAIFIETGSPMFYTVSLLVLSISLIPKHLHVGTAGILFAVVAYALRTTTLQGRYMRMQQELREARDRLEMIALTDALTNTANRRSFDQTLAAEWQRAQRTRDPLALLLIDIDFFKTLNDEHGHPAGDRCLAAVAEALKSASPRAGDPLARYGGEEFAAILPVCRESGARSVAQRMQAAVHALAIPNLTPTGSLLTISIGIAAFEFPDAGSTADLVDAADRALYRAKLLGRNRIEAEGRPAADPDERVRDEAHAIASIAEVLALPDAGTHSAHAGGHLPAPAGAEGPRSSRNH